MATFKQNTVENTDYSTMDGAESGFGKRDKTVLEAAFSASPLYATDATYNTEDTVIDLAKEMLQGEKTGMGFTDEFGNIQGSSAYYASADDINLNYVAKDGAPLNDVAGNTKTIDDLPFGGG